MQPSIQWYPGHIAKYERQLSELLKLVDVVVVVLDCRIPQATVNPRLASKIGDKPTLIILNKSDLGDVSQNKRWMKSFTGENQRAMLHRITGSRSESSTGQMFRQYISARPSLLTGSSTRISRRRSGQGRRSNFRSRTAATRPSHPMTRDGSSPIFWPIRKAMRARRTRSLARSR